MNLSGVVDGIKEFVECAIIVNFNAIYIEVWGGQAKGQPVKLWSWIYFFFQTCLLILMYLW